MTSQAFTKRCPKCNAEMELFPLGRSITYKCNNCGYEEKLVTY